MAVAVLACVHANLAALTAVLHHAASAGVTRIVSLGDVVGYGSQPRECLRLLLRSEIAIRGNHEEAVLSYGEVGPRAKASIEWTRRELASPAYPDAENRRLREFLESMRDVVEDGDVMYVHGSPRVPTRDYVVPQDNRNREKMADIFQRIRRVCFIGHSHIPHLYWSDGSHATPHATGHVLDLGDLAGRKVLVNVGSVGQPRDGDPRASYVTFDGNCVRFHRLDVRGETDAPAPRS